MVLHHFYNNNRRGFKCLFYYWFSILKVHSYRAALEELVIKYWPHLKHSGMRSIKHSNQLSFKTLVKY